MRLYSTSSRLTGTTTRGLDKLLALSPSSACQGGKQTSLVMFRESRVLRRWWNTLLWVYSTSSGLAGTTNRLDTLLIPSPPAYQAGLEFCGGGGTHSCGYTPHLPGWLGWQRKCRVLSKCWFVCLFGRLSTGRIPKCIVFYPGFTWF